jgi:hypothetical protein
MGLGLGEPQMKPHKPLQAPFSGIAALLPVGDGYVKPSWVLIGMVGEKP